MKTIDVLFDVSGSIKNKFNNIKDVDNKDINKVNKKPDELINILKKLVKNTNANIFTILFGLQDWPYIIDFIKLIQMYNEKFKKITTKDDDNPAINTYILLQVYLFTKNYLNLSIKIKIKYYREKLI